MKDIIEEIGKVQISLSTIKNKYKKEAIKAVKQGFKALFEQYPEIENINFTAYTMYFNDGDPCTYRVYEPNVVFKKEYIENLKNKYPDLEDIDEEDDCEGWDLDELEHLKDKYIKQMCSNIETVHNLLAKNKDIALDLFGDHCRVKYLANNEFEVEEYDHD